MGFKLYKFFIKYYKKFLFLSYLFFKKISTAMWLTFKVLRFTNRWTSRKWWNFKQKTADNFWIFCDYFFYFKKHLYDEGFCVVLYFVWCNFGFKWFFHKFMKVWFWKNVVETWWIAFPEWLEFRFLWELNAYRWARYRFNHRRKNFWWRVYAYSETYRIYLRKKKNYKKIQFQFSVFVFVYAFIAISFIAFFFINILSKWFFLFKKRIIFFVLSSIKYLVLYLKFRWYFFFLEHFKKFNLHSKRRRSKKKIYLADERFYEIDDFYYVIFNFFVNSIKRTKNIFLYYKFRKDLSFYGFGERRKWHKTHVYYNFLFLKSIKKKYKRFYTQKYFFWFKNLWLYSINYNFFYFHKIFFFIYNFLYSNIANALDMYLDLYLNIIIYLAS